MKRLFADLHLSPPLNDFNYTCQLVKKAKKLGYHLLGFSTNLYTNKNSLISLKNFCKEIKIDFVSRIDLNPTNRNELKSQLRSVRRKYEVICVKCETKEVARQAAQDRRVDLLNFPSLFFKKRFFDHAEAELASNSLAALEIDIKPLIILKGSSRTRLLSFLRRETAIAKKFKIPIILSSGIEKITFQRKPQEIATLMDLFDFDASLALDTVSKNPYSIVLRNRAKLSPSYIAPGIRIIKEGKI